jgi:hypothetical protein
MQAAIPPGEMSMKSEPNAPLLKNVNEPTNIDNCIEMASAMLAVESSLVMVGYRTRLPIYQSRGRTLFILDEKTGKRLDVQNVSFLGALASCSAGRKRLCNGYFIADNAEQIISPGSKITVFVGEMKIENIVVSG